MDRLLAGFGGVDIPSQRPDSARSRLRRRDLLGLATLAPVAVAFTGGCSSAEPEGPDPLLNLDRAARSDAALARAIASAHPDLAGAVTAVADARAQHARALRREIDRVDPPDPKQPGPREPKAKAPDTATAAVDALATALRQAQADAARLLPTLPPYRAGMVGSVSASCACLLEVLA